MVSPKNKEIIQKELKKYKIIFKLVVQNKPTGMADAIEICKSQIKTTHTIIIWGDQIGIKTKDNKEALVDDLMQDGHIDFDEEMYCVYLPEEEIKRRTKYNWFLKLDKEDIFTSNTVAGKYLLISHGY